ncbi:MAG: MerR family transcriptional regulator [Dehalococcoidia bacterium]|nr:MerR family transcriptional regulator [Dehalococcoidia bacterium]
MPTTLMGTRYYQTAEACQLAGISKNTFFRWLRSGEIDDVSTVDRHGWRLFTDEDLARLCRKAQHVTTRELLGALPVAAAC